MSGKTIVIGSCDSCLVQGSITCLMCVGVYVLEVDEAQLGEMLERDVVEEMSVEDAAAVADRYQAGRIDVQSIPSLCKSPGDCNQSALGMCVNCPFNALPPCWHEGCERRKCLFMQDDEASQLREAGSQDYGGMP